ncbi:hypothetical protein Pmani_033460 [Petrolisthes manimaculis]|uniref:Neuroguidin n=1 Tax=Petrolisthes manimaculis TaxID=1843537 RepID=A0AAE1NRJ4_9EUCA|nr:hypothetical protein Pmani_033460 [Petrolisthes manimaculis]
MAENSTQSKVDGCVASDLPKGVALLADLTTNLNTVRATFEALMGKIKDENMKTGQGISLLELKNQSFLAYMANLACITLRKLKGLKLENDPSIERLVELRVVLERIRPLEDKLKYQIDKYVKVATEGVVNAEEPLQLKGNLDNIGSSSEEEDDTEQDQTTKKKKSGDVEEEKYKIPKVRQAHFDGEAGKDAAKERQKRRAWNSSMLRDAFHEYTEDPEVVYDTDILKQRAIRKRKELDKYEEDRMLRKSVSKKEKAAMKQLPTVGTLGSEILSFSSLNPLQGFDSSAPAAKKQKTVPKSTKGKKGKAKGKKGFKKRIKH